MKSFSMSKIRDRIKNMKKTDWLILVLIGILILIIAVPTNGEKSKGSSPTDEELAVAENQAAAQNSRQDGADDTVKSKEVYVKALEEELADLLGAMSGVGKVKVMITLQNMGEDILDKNMDSDENSYSSSTVLYDCGDYEAPYVIRQDAPQIEGVVVVCEGGGDAVVAAKISDVIQSLFSVEMHKITVVKMSASEGTN